MKITMEKTIQFTFDTSKERKRIEKCFNVKGSKTVYKKLMKLMDLIEAEEWEKANNELESDWWRGRDKEQECSRLEFVGLLEGEGIADWTSYANLVWRLANFPEMYKVKDKK
jgi:hypothetical protein